MGVLDEFLVERLAYALNAGWEPDLPVDQRVREALLGVTIGTERIVAMLKGASVNATPQAPGGTSR